MQNESSGQFLEIFQPDEIQQLIDILNKLKNSPNSGKFKAYTNGFRSTDLIYPFIKKNVINRLEQLFNRPLNLLLGMLLKEQMPWKIHTDYEKGDTNPDLAILIPLNHILINTHTVVFNELCMDSFDNYKLKNTQLVNNATNIYDSLMSHESNENLKYVSLRNAYSWIPGSVIYWDRKLLHASDNFLKANLAEKTALVLFTQHQ
jgi:hypothetical protein